MGVMDFIIIFVVTIMLAFALFVGYTLYIDSKEFKPASYNIEESNVNITSSTQFYPNMRFPDKRISYFISESCPSDKVKNINEALDILDSKTVLSFYEGDENSEIEYLCSEVMEERTKEKYFIAGEGGPKEIVNSGEFNVILSGKVSLYREEKCDSPNVAIHETLHVLGFDHNNNEKSIMYPITACDLEIDDYILYEINDLYSTPDLPDLAIDRVELERTGRYINFEIEISNKGLKRAENIVFEVYADDALIKSYDIDDLGIGYIRKITVTSLRIPSESRVIDFEVRSNSGEGEIENSNNVASIVTEEK